jgi:2-phosphoxylose phosphatase
MEEGREMGCAVLTPCFSSRETTNRELYARVLYSGHVLETIHGALDWIPIAELITILRPFVPDDIVALCNS